MQKILLSAISLIISVSHLVGAPVTEKETDTHSLQKENSARNKENNGISIPSQGLPPSLTLNDGPTYNFNANTNLVSLLADIRKHISSKEYKIAHSMAQAALQSIQQTEQNKFYLNQIRKEETKIYYVQAKLAMSQDKYSLASQLLEKYRENIEKDLSERKIDDLQEARNKSSEIEDKLSLIKIPEVSFFKSPLDEAMQELMLKSKQFDLTEQDPAKKGIPITVMEPSDGDSFPLVTITLKNMELGKMIQWITEMVNWTYDIKAEAVVISKSGGGFKGRALETKFYEVTQGTINRMTGTGGGADDTGQKIKAFLERIGIRFDDGKGHKFVFDGFQMIVTHDRRSLDLIELILAKVTKINRRR